MKQTNFHKISKGITVAVFLLSFIKPLAAQPDSLANLPQYLFSRFDTSIVKLKTGELTKLTMNYNTLTEKLAFFQKGKLLDITKPETIDTVCIQKRVFIPVEGAFYEVILNAGVSFFIQHKSDLISEGRPAALGTTSQTSGVTSVSKFVGDRNSYNLKLPENFRVKPYDIYWVRTNNEMHRFLNEHQFLKIFPANGDALKDFINRSHIKLNKNEDLLKLANFCNEIMK